LVVNTNKGYEILVTGKGYALHIKWKYGDIAFRLDENALKNKEILFDCPHSLELNFATFK